MDGIRTAWRRDRDTGNWLGHYCLGPVGKPDNLFCIIERPGGRGFSWVAEFVGANRVCAVPALRDAKDWGEAHLHGSFVARAQRTAVR